MRAAIILLLLTSCYSKEKAVEQLKSMGRPEPIRCVIMAGRGAETDSFSCTDGESRNWLCDSDGCIAWGTK
jgi:hypothetical protein